MMTDPVPLPTAAEATLLQGWHQRLERLHEDIVAQLQSLECADELGRSLDEHRSKYVAGWTMRLYVHWAAIGVRRAFRRTKYPRNISLQGLLEEFSTNACVVERHGNASALRRWLNIPSSATMTADVIATGLNVQTHRLDAELRDVCAYANTIAHLQKEEVRLKKRQIREALRSLREVVKTWYEILGAEEPSLNENAFLDGFEQELSRVLCHVES